MFWKLVARVASIPRVADWLIRRAQRTPYIHIYDPQTGEMYMGRWWLFNPYPSAEDQRRKRWQFPISVRIHHIMRPDTARDHHDHPWNARTIILRGGYREVRLEDGHNISHCRLAGDTAKINFGEYHTIKYIPPGGAWTIFITGKYRGTWGFLVNGVKVQWRKYLGIQE